ncbi:GNAT family N-acetyltransferase [Pseudomonas sp. KNUC1026]|uniref:GNAT family N-acetyltransferase n=1 Tax=Pseudomonas sp. KNUC1026 TaxID=2893890 RepID=UPI001F362C85|nr:GNAT family N-acetyltransferase [Pseudomonas sp. KNUC1026]UFH50448.1 GNAT family N-acetyltransferase [Pseudomonas sp. KNUC1026]
MQTLENAAFAAWPAALDAEVHGWCLRLDTGYTKRANSLNLTDRSQPLTHTQLEAIEQQFAARGLRPVIRLTSLLNLPTLEPLLIERGYRFSDASHVLCRVLQAPTAEPQPSVHLLGGPAQWIPAFAQLSGQGDEQAQAHQAILQRIAHPAAWAVWEEGGVPGCCGLGVVVGEQLGLFDIVTGEAFQRRGLAERLCRALFGWGWEQGARQVFLQVAADNRPALALYEKLGFERAYGYGYWVKP